MDFVKLTHNQIWIVATLIVSLAKQREEEGAAHHPYHHDDEGAPGSHPYNRHIGAERASKVLNIAFRPLNFVESLSHCGHRHSCFSLSTSCMCLSRTYFGPILDISCKYSLN